MDDRFLSELDSEPPQAPARLAARSFHELMVWGSNIGLCP
jgi:hypothetical protein